MIRKYYNEYRGQMQVTPPEDYKTISIKKIQGCPKVDKKEYARAIHETEIISISAISEVEIVEIISVLSLKRSDGRN
jgi:hypothetical protein